MTLVFSYRNHQSTFSRWWGNSWASIYLVSPSWCREAIPQGFWSARRVSLVSMYESTSVSITQWNWVPRDGCYIWKLPWLSLAPQCDTIQLHHYEVYKHANLLESVPTASV